MDINSISMFFADYSIHSIFIAISIAVIKLTIEKVSKNTKINFTIVAICITIVLDLAYSMIFIEKSFAITNNMLYSAMLSGGLTTIISSIARKVLSGKKITLDKTTLFLEELLNSYRLDFSDNEKTAEKIKSILDDNELELTQKEEEISNTLRENVLTISELEVYSVTKIIMENAEVEKNDK